MPRTTSAALIIPLALFAACPGPKTYWEGPEPPRSSSEPSTGDDGTDAPAQEAGTTTGGGEAAPQPRVVSRVRLGKPTVPAAYADAATNTLSPALRDMEACHQRELAFDATLAGTITIVFTLDAKGVLQTIVATGVDENVGNCMAGVIEGLKFPAPRDKRPVKITYPYELSVLPG